MTKRDWKWLYEVNVSALKDWPEETMETIEHDVLTTPSATQIVITWKDAGKIYVKGDGESPEVVSIPGRLYDLEQERVAS